MKTKKTRTIVTKFDYANDSIRCFKETFIIKSLFTENVVFSKLNIFEKVIITVIYFNYSVYNRLKHRPRKVKGHKDLVSIVM